MRKSPIGESRSTLEAEVLSIEARLAELDRHLSLTSDEQMEWAKLKKLKLANKDRLALLALSGIDGNEKGE